MYILAELFFHPSLAGSQFWQPLFPKVANFGKLCFQKLPFLATFMQCQIFLSNSGNP